MSPTAESGHASLNTVKEALDTRFRLVITAISLPLALIIMMLAYSHYKAENNLIIGKFEHNSTSLVSALNQITGLANNYSSQLQLALNRCMAAGQLKIEKCLVEAQNSVAIFQQLDSFFTHGEILLSIEAKAEQGIEWKVVSTHSTGGIASAQLSRPLLAAGQPVATLLLSIQMEEIQELCQQLSQGLGRLVVIDDRHRVIADSAAAVTSSGVFSAEILPQLKLTKPLEQSWDLTALKQTRLLIQPVEYAPWSVLYLVSNHEYRYLLIKRLLPYLIILVALILMFVLAIFLLRRLFIQPALSLAAFIQSISKDVATPLPHLPSPWQVCANVVATQAEETLERQRSNTAMRQSEAELARQRYALQQSEKLSAMGALLAGVAHELNNPLAILVGRSTLLESKTQDESLLADVKKIQVAADRCARIVHRFLAMARQQPPRRTLVALNDVIEAALDLLRYSLRASDIEVILELAEDLPLVEMDGDQIGQVIMNLIINAQQALEPKVGDRFIKIASSCDNDYLYVQVMDNGIGIPTEIQDRIFEPFFTTKTDGVGTGVGLSLSRTIVREHNGQILLEQEKPTAFLVRLPKANAATQSFDATEVNKANLAIKTALIVDDEIELAEILGEILQAEGLNTVEVASGQEALHWLSHNHCDFILSDIRMPDMDGIGLWHSLTKLNPDLAKRMVFITGDTLSSSVNAFIQQNDLSRLEKPFSPDDVLALLSRIENH